MVGGVVIGLTHSEGRTHVHVAACPHYPKHGQGDECPNPDTCCVYVDQVDGVVIGIGDSIWWQSGQCYWTPKARRGQSGGRCGVDYDIPLPKIGYSH